MNEQQRAATILFDLAEAWFLYYPAQRRADGSWAGSKPKPGETLNALSQETKELLKSLKSDDVKKVRWPPWK